MNTVKTFFLLAALTILLVVVGQLVGGRTGMIIAFSFAVILNFGSYWYSDKIVLRIQKARRVERSDAPDLFRITEELTAAAGLPMPALYVIESEQPNAFATGRNPERAAVAVTTGIMRLLSGDELRGVIAHELTHVKNRDILVATIAATVAGAITMLANIAQWALIFGTGGRGDRDGGNPIALLVTIIVAPIAALLIQMAISRSREFMADEGGAAMAGNPLSLANALRKLHQGVEKFPVRANPSTAHLFIVSPLSGGGISKLFSTHPPVEERIARLEQMVYGTLPR